MNPIFFIFESCIHKGINILNSLVKKFLGFSFFLVFLLTISGCTASSNFNIKNLAKSNIDLISELHMDQAISLLKALTEKLYKKNPEELKKNPGQTIESRMEQIFI